MKEISNRIVDLRLSASRVLVNRNSDSKSFNYVYFLDPGFVLVILNWPLRLQSCRVQKPHATQKHKIITFTVNCNSKCQSGFLLERLYQFTLISIFGPVLSRERQTAFDTFSHKFKGIICFIETNFDLYSLYWEMKSKSIPFVIYSFEIINFDIWSPLRVKQKNCHLRNYIR